MSTVHTSSPFGPFGEFLVRRGLIDRYQLLRVLQLQVRNPAIRIGECVVALGFLSMEEIETELDAYETQRANRRLARGTEPPVDSED